MLALSMTCLVACGAASEVEDACSSDAGVRDASIDANIDANIDADEVADARFDAGLDVGVLDAGEEDAGEPDTEPETPVHLRPQSKTQILLFDPARDRGETIGYHSFRIPALIRTTEDTLIAFAEARQCAADDFGNINMVMRRSHDHGRTWGPLEEVEGGGPGTWGNPTPVVDETTGRIWLFMSFNGGDVSQFGRVNPCTGETTRTVAAGDRPVFVTHSDDDGDTWSRPANMTATLQRPGTAWDAMGPGIGIQTRVANRGRLVIPAAGRNIYSDDHGATWRYQRIPGGSSEGTIVELSDGRLMRNDRVVPRLWDMAERRWISRGTIEADRPADEMHFEAFAPHDALLDPRVQGSTLLYNGDAPRRILFLNPASTVARCRMRVRISYDDGVTWPLSRQLHDVSAASTCDMRLGGYSSMIKTADFHVGALVERATANRAIEFHRFNLPWILDGTPEP